MGILFGPISILVVVCQSSIEKVSNHSTKECPHCFGVVDGRATVCKYCARDINSIDECVKPECVKPESVKPESVKRDVRTDLDIQLANAAATMSDYEGCKKLIAEGANLNAKDAFGLTAKDYARGKNSTKIRRLN